MGQKRLMPEAVDDKEGWRRYLKSRTTVNEAGCWIWNGAIDKWGYGRLGVTSGTRKRSCNAHRISYLILAEGDPSLCACHSCDTPACCNPDHLFAGTSGDNNRDAAKKGRSSRGERRYNSKLTDAAAAEILSCNSPCSELSKKLGVSKNTIQNVRSGITWRHVKVGVEEPSPT